MLTDTQRQDYGLTTPGAGSGSAGLELRLELVLVELQGLRADLARLKQPAEPEADAEAGTTKIREPKPTKPASPKAKKADS